MALPYDPVWAEEGPRHAPTSAEVEDGFACGPASRELFNWLFWRIFTQFNELTTDLLTAPGSQGLLNSDTMLIEASRGSGAASRPMTSAFQPWRLNSVVQNEISGASVSGSTYYVTLPAGRYNVIYAGAAYSAGAHQVRLYDRSNGVEIGHGLLQDSFLVGNGTNQVTNTSHGATTFTLSETTQISLDHACLNDTPEATYGDNTAVFRVDAFLKIEREKGVV